MILYNKLKSLRKKELLVVADKLRIKYTNNNLTKNQMITQLLMTSGAGSDNLRDIANFVYYSEDDHREFGDGDDYGNFGDGDDYGNFGSHDEFDIVFTTIHISPIRSYIDQGEFNINDYELCKNNTNNSYINNYVTLINRTTKQKYTFDELLGSGHFGQTYIPSKHPNFPFIIKKNLKYEKKCTLEQYKDKKRCSSNGGEWIIDKTKTPQIDTRITDEREISAIKYIQDSGIDCSIIDAKLLPSTENPKVILMKRADGDLNNYIKYNVLRIKEDLNELIRIRNIYNDIIIKVFNIYKCVVDYGKWYTDIKSSNLLYKLNDDNQIQIFIGDLGGFCKEDDNNGVFTYGTGNCNKAEMTWLFSFFVVKTFIDLYNIDLSNILPFETKNWSYYFRERHEINTAEKREMILSFLTDDTIDVLYSANPNNIILIAIEYLLLTKEKFSKTDIEAVETNIVKDIFDKELTLREDDGHEIIVISE